MLPFERIIGWTRLGIFLPPLLVFAGVSCSSAKKDDRKPVYPVRGQIFFKDKPAAGAFVLLVPVNEPAPPKDPRPRAYVEKDGTFSLTTYDEKDGAPAGDYIVTVTWPVGEEEQDRLQSRYSDPKTSKLRGTVKEGPNELPPYKLQ